MRAGKTLCALAVVLSGALTVPAAGVVPAAQAAPARSPSEDAPRLATPPMGWNHWNHFRCDIDERIIKQTADALVRTGLRDSGYRYLNVDDCWSASTRDSAGRLRADPRTFPGGIAALADYAHARGLKFGIYTAAGAETCEGRPGSGGHYRQDAHTFASWGVDYVKFDWCGATGDPHALASRFRAALDATGRRMALGVSRHGAPWTWPDRPADLWRTSADIDDEWHSLLRNTEEQAGLSTMAGQGRGWNDPDMLQVGNGKMTATEYRAHLSMWAITGAPLLMGNDLRTVDDATLAMLRNREVIAVDQDKLGAPGDRLRGDGDREVWARRLAGGDVAVALFNRGAQATEIRSSAREIGAPGAAHYRLHDLWSGAKTVTRGGITAHVPPHGVALFRVSANRTGARHATLTSDARYLEPGRENRVSVTSRGAGVGIGLRVPAGWALRPLGPAVELPGQGGRARFAVRPPADASGPARLTLSAGERTVPHAVTVPPAPPRGTVALSDHPRIETDNGWYLPMKVNRSFGPDDFCEDCEGGPITLRGKHFRTGLGTYGPAQVSYYLGGRCDRFRTTVGVDDEVLGMDWPGEHNARGTARFRIYADGREAFDSGVRTMGKPPTTALLDVRGVRQLKLISESAGDGNFADHADWADMTIRCAP